MRAGHIFAVLTARNREFFRDRGSLSWNILFPVLMVVGFALLFADERPELYKVGVYGDGRPAALAGLDYVDAVPVAADGLDDAVSKVRRHRLDLLFDTVQDRYWVNLSSPRGYLLEKVLAGTDPGRFEQQPVDGTQIRYVDWVVPGVLATNMMFSALFGVGYVIVRYRHSGVLRRLKATPLKPAEFLAAQVLSRLWLIVVIGVLVYAGTDYVVNFSMSGSYWTLLLVFVLGAASLISLGLLMAARTANQELAGGLLNLISWPMMLLSGAWFSLEGSPEWVRRVSEVFPLTHLIEAARAVMLDGVGLAEIGWRLVVLAVMTAVFLWLGARLFRWE